VVLFGAPYLPTRRPQAEAALDLLNLKPGQTFYDLGCGDGRLLRLAAQRGIKAVGYELNPILALAAGLVNWRYRKLVRVKLGNFWYADISNADGIFVFLVGKRMRQLDKFIASRGGSRPLKLVSYGFQIPGKKSAGKSGAMYLYKY
jgi:SAM-dependent methyltransferase